MDNNYNQDYNNMNNYNTEPQQMVTEPVTNPGVEEKMDKVVGEETRKGVRLSTSIILLGIIIGLGVVWFNLFMTGEKGEDYVESIRDVVEGAKELVKNDTKYDFTNKNVTYYVSNKCITGKEDVTSPYGQFMETYVVITLDEDIYNYYWIGTDAQGHGIATPTPINRITKDTIVENVLPQDIKTTTPMDGKEKIRVIDSSCKGKDDYQANVTISKTFQADENGYKRLKIVALRDVDNYYEVTKVGILYSDNFGLGYFSKDDQDLSKEENIDVEELLKTNRTGGVKEVIAKNNTNKGEYALVITIVKETDYFYAIPYVVVKNDIGEEKTVYGTLISISYATAQQ